MEQYRTIELFNANAEMYWDLDWVYEETIQRLEKNYNLCIIPCVGRWNGPHNGALQDITTIDIPWCDVIKLEIKDKALEITTAHHDGRNTYKIHCMDSNSPTVEEFYNEKQNNDYYDYKHGATLYNEKDIEEYINLYCLSMYDLFHECKI